MAFKGKKPVAPPPGKSIAFCPKCKVRRFVFAGKCVQCGTKVGLC